MFWKVEREDSIEPPIQTKYFLSAGAVIFTFIPAPATLDTYLFNLSVKFGNIVVPPDSTMFEYKSFLISPSHFMTDWYVISWIPGNYFPIRLGLKRASGHLKIGSPMFIIWPSGSLYYLSFWVDYAASALQLAYVSVLFHNLAQLHTPPPWCLSLFNFPRLSKSRCRSRSKASSCIRWGLSRPNHFSQ